MKLMYVIQNKQVEVEVILYGRSDRAEGFVCALCLYYIAYYQLRRDAGGIFVIRDWLKIFSVNCDCYYCIFVNCDLYATVIRDFINIFLVICEKDLIFLFKIWVLLNNLQQKIESEETVLLRWNSFGINAVLFHTQMRHFRGRGDGVTHDVVSGTTVNYGTWHFNNITERGAGDIVVLAMTRLTPKLHS